MDDLPGRQGLSTAMRTRDAFPGLQAAKQRSCESALHSYTETPDLQTMSHELRKFLARMFVKRFDEASKRVERTEFRRHSPRTADGSTPR